MSPVAAPLGEFGEIAFDGVQRRCRCGGKVEGPSRMVLKPFFDLRMLVGGVIVDDGVNGLALGNGGLRIIQEADELLVPVALHAASDLIALDGP